MDMKMDMKDMNNRHDKQMADLTVLLSVFISGTFTIFVRCLAFVLRLYVF